MMEEIYLVADGGHAKALLEAWREDFFAARRRLEEFMRRVGATRAVSHEYRKPALFEFPADAVPATWRWDPSRRAATPVPGRDAAADHLHDMAWCEDLDEIVAELGLPLGLARGGDTESFPLTRGDAPGPVYSACWPGQGGQAGSFILIAPDFEARRREARRAFRSEPVWRPAGSSPLIPEGLRQISSGAVEDIMAGPGGSGFSRRRGMLL